MTSESPSTTDRLETESMIICESSISRTILGPDPDAFQRWERQQNATVSSGVEAILNGEDAEQPQTKMKNTSMQNDASE